MYSILPWGLALALSLVAYFLHPKRPLGRPRLNAIIRAVLYFPPNIIILDALFDGKQLSWEQLQGILSIGVTEFLLSYIHELLRKIYSTVPKRHKPLFVLGSIVGMGLFSLFLVTLIVVLSDILPT
ncbi:MAG: hypothetical protein HN802_01120 [Candidatus Jacksonbacteria bacterium]|jgi:hypothetical protein|nr:hypothetical protein [Candidatus Jacksonbacteria bacterium]MBT7338285.1 hypothetical protein [Candidatus Jacksonbacteria bacterium]